MSGCRLASTSWGLAQGIHTQSHDRQSGGRAAEAVVEAHSGYRGGGVLGDPGRSSLEVVAAAIGDDPKWLGRIESRVPTDS